MRHGKHGFFSMLVGLALLLSSCAPAGSSTQDAAAIYTAAAKTVEARFTQMAAESTPISPTPTATKRPAKPTATPTFPPMPSPAPGLTTVPCLAANFIQDVTIPDYTLIKPGETFRKTWRVKNSGSCTWGSSYALVFDSGSAMTETYSFPLSVINPGQTADISINLTAPSVEGTYQGFWRLKTPWGGTLGFGMYDESLWVLIVVEEKPKYAVTSIGYTIERDPASGCPANIKYIITATITVNGPVEVVYHWVRSDGEPDEEIHPPLVFNAAGSKTVKYVWQIHRGATTNPRWVAVYVDSPNNQQIGEAAFVFDCL